MKRTKKFIEWHNRNHQRIHGKISKPSECMCIAGEAWDYAESLEEASRIYKEKVSRFQ